MAIPVATRLVTQALREEASALQLRALASDTRDDWAFSIVAGALESVADRVEASGSSVHPRTPPSADPAPTVSPQGDEPGSGNKAHPGPEVQVIHPPALVATLKELKRQLDDIGVTSVYPRIAQLVDDCIKLSSD